MSAALPPDDPFGDRAWQEAQRNKGRAAILDAQDLDFEPDERPAAPEGSPGADVPGKPDEPEFDQLRIPRLIGKIVRWVPISLPDGSPVTPLGVQGGVYWFLNYHGELIGMDAGKFGQSHIQGLFAPQLDWLYRAFPQFNQQRQWKGFQAQYAQAALMAAAGAKGVFDARDKVRGLGCWKGRDGQLIQHLGDRVLIADREEKPGEIDGYVYPGRPPLCAPARGGMKSCQDVATRVRTWRWARGELDARLLIGWLGCSILGAALKWRPMVFITGDAGTGKSSLQDELKAMLPGRLVSTVDASPAGLRQVLNQDAVAVSFDEIEADVLSDQAQQVMKLARVAASGGTVFRGGADHKHAEFQLRGAFAFSAIIPPSMRQQDMQRFAFLRLRALGDQQAPASLTPADAEALGAGLVGRITERFGEWEGVLASYKAALEAEGHAKRGAEQFGALLAAADLMLEPDKPDAMRLAQWSRQLKRANLFEYENSEPIWLTAWNRLLSAQPEVWRQDQFPTVAEVVRKYLKACEAHIRVNSAENLNDKNRLHDRLNRAGLAVVQQRGSGKLFLAIPCRHQAIASIYAGSDFQARGGDGAWSTVLRGAPDDAWRADNVKRLNGVKCTLMWLDAEVDLAGAPTRIFERDPKDDELAEDLVEREPGEEG